MFIGWAGRQALRGSFDSPAREFACVTDREGVHCRFGRKIRAQVRGCATARAARRHPHHEPLTLLPQLRQDGAIDPLRAQDAGIVELRELLYRKRLRRPIAAMFGIVHHNLEPPVVENDLCNCRIH